MTEKNEPNYDDFFAEFPDEVSWLLREGWNNMPEERQNQLIDLLPALSASDSSGLRRLFDMGREHVQMAFGQKHDVVIVGPTNVGKSTLYNQLIREKGDVAEVSPVPGTTKVNQTADAGIFSIVDTPGVDAVGAQGAVERQHAMTAAESADFLIILFDAVQGVKQTELQLFRDLTSLGKPYVVALNKMDLVGRRQRKTVITQVAANLGLKLEEVIPIQAQDGKDLERILLAIVKSEPQLLAALGRSMPAYRSRLAWQAIFRSATSSAVVALTPIPIVDFIPLAAVQGMLVLSIARVYNYKLTPRRAQELISSLGFGYLGRILFYELTKLGGPPTWVVGSAVAASTTVVVGYASILWFDKGEKLTVGKTRELSRMLAKRFMARLRGMGRRRPSREELADEMAEALKDVEIDISES